MSAYDDYLNGLAQEDTKRERLTTSLGEAATVNPDEFASQVKLAKAASISLDALPQYKAEAQQAKLFGEVGMDRLWKDAPKTADFLSHPDHAKLSSDDTANLSGFEQAYRLLSNSGRAVASAVPRITSGLWGAAAAPFELVGADGVGGFLRDQQRFGQGMAKAWGPQGAPSGNIESGWYSGLTSAGQNLIAMPMAFLPGGQSAALTAMVAPVFGESYGKARDKGLSPLQGINYGTQDAAAEWAGEKLGLGSLVKNVKVGSGFGKTLVDYLAREVPSEMATTLAQSFNEYANINPEKPVGEWVKQLPDEMAQTVVATLVGGGAITTTVKVADKAIQMMVGKQQEAQQAGQMSELLGRMNQYADASNLRMRDTETAQGFFQSILDEGRDAVYISPEALAQSGLAEQMAQYIPAVAEQLGTAAEAGHDIRIPIADLMATMAGPELEQSLLPHVAVEPGGFTPTTAQEYLQSDQAKELQAEVDRVLGEKEGDDTFKASAQAVKTTVKDQLTTAGRFTESVNDAYSSMVGNFYAVQAARMGTTPEEMFKRYPLRIGAESIAGQQFDQGRTLQQLRDDLQKQQAGLDAYDAEIRGGVDPDGDKYFGLADKVTEAMDAFVADLEQIPDDSFSLQAKTKDGRLLLVNPSAQKPGHYQLTRFGSDGNPWGDTQYPTKKQAIKDFLDESDASTVKDFGGQLNQSARMNTDTPEFRNWFGDSKVVDADGKPMVVYHGTGATDISEFKVSKGGTYGGGIYLTPEVRGANDYAIYRGAPTSTVYPAYVTIKNPASGAEAAQVASWKGEELARDELIKRGYDGVVDMRSGEIVAFYPEQIKSATGNRGTFDPNDPNILNQQARGSFNPATLQLTLLKNADLSTALHEFGHFFLEVQADLAGQLMRDAAIHGADTLKPGEQQVVKDMQATLDWFGIKDLSEWNALDFEEKRSYHEKFARGFESYLFEGKAPSIEMQGLFQRFRAWMLNVYRDLKALNVELTDEVRSVFDRMLATNEQIVLAEQGRSMMPLFTSPEQIGMTPAEFADYQALGTDATNEAIEDLQARGLRDMQWLHNARGRVIKQLQKESAAKRAEVKMGVRAEVMSQPIYRAWQFLTGKMTADDQIDPVTPPKSDPNVLDETIDSLFAAIAKLGGINKDDVVKTWGVDPADKPTSGLFGKPLWRVEGGLSIDGMAEALSQYGYLEKDENGKWDIRELEEKFKAELGGDSQFSTAYDYAGNQPIRPGDQVANPMGLAAGRLDRSSLTEIGLPVEIIEHLDKLRMVRKDGIHPDIVAEMFGFTSGDELVRRLAAAEAPKAEIEALTDQRMLEQFGDLSSEEAIKKAADKAIHNDVRARLVATELAALEKATGKRTTLASAAKEYAAAMIARLKVRDIKPGQYAAGEVRAAKATEKASKAGDLATAAAEKRNQLINTYATRAAYDAQDEVEKGLRYLGRFDKPGSIDKEYVEQIQALRDRYDLRKSVSGKDIDREHSLRTWVQAQLNAGELPLIAESLLTPAERAAYVAQIESRGIDGELVYADDEERIKLLADAIDRSEKRSYKTLTVEEFRGLIDTVKQIEHLGRLKHKLMTARDDAAYEAVRDSIAIGIAAESSGGGKNTRTANDWLGQRLQAIKQFGAAHIKVATWARIMDGGKDNGPVWRYLVQPANERASQETTMRAEATTALDAIVRPIMDKVPMADKIGKGKFFPTMNDSLNWQERFTILLNLGNESNTQRLMAGKGWTMAQIKPVLDTFSAEELRAAQAIWDHFESYRPLIASKELRVSGKEPEWIPARQITLKSADGQTVTMRGGYYPVVYDQRVNLKASQHSAAEEAKNQFKASYSAATTRRSFTKSRVEEVHGRPILLNMQGLYSGVNDVIHDLAWHEWVMDANKLLRSKTIDTAIREHYGPEVKREFEKWRDDIVAGNRRLDHAIEKAAGWARQSVSASALTFNILSAAMQPLGLANSISRVGATWIGKGVARYVAAPIQATREAQEKSEWLANRTRTRFRELNELRNQVQGQTAARELMGRYGYWMMMRMQMTVDVPTWWGSYEKAIAEGHDEETAINLADQSVKDSQGGGEEVDQSGVERGGPLVKLFTAFYGFMGTTANTVYLTGKTEKSKAKAAANMLMVLVVPAVIGSLLKSALVPGDDGDDDKLAKKLIIEQLSFLAGLIAFGREFTPLIKAVSGESKGQSYSGPTGLRVIPDTINLGKQAGQGEFDDAFRKAFINVAGDLTGIPSVQINRTITGTKALIDGETDNPAAIAFGFQKPR